MTQPLLQIRKFVSQRRVKLLANRAAAGSLIVFSAYLAASAVLSILFSVIPWTLLPLLWIFTGLLLIFALAIIPVVLIIRRPTLIKTARIIESKSNIKHPSLSLSLELSENEAGGSQSLKEQAYRRAAHELEEIRKTRFLKSRKRIYAAAASLLLLNTVLISFSSNKLVHYWKLPFVLIAGERTRVEPGSVTVPMNASVNLRLSGGSRFPSARLEVWPLDGQNRIRHFLKTDSTGEFSLPLQNVKESFVYQFSLSSPMPPETVTVVPPPGLRSLRVTLIPPAYTKLPRRELALGQGNITAYGGTKVNITLESTYLKNAGLVIGNDTVSFDVKEKTAAGSLIVSKSAEYTFFLIDTLGQSSNSLPRFMISRIEDEPPAARILRPGANKVLSAAQAETLWVEGVDDFGISKMILHWKRSGNSWDSPPSKNDVWDISEKGNPPLIRKQLAWNLRELSLYPGDTVYYWLWVRDNKPFGKPQTACSDTFWFRVPSFEEIHKEIVRKEQYAQEKIGQVRNRQEQISNSVEKLVKSAVGSKELSWDQQRVLEDVKEQMKAQADSLQKAMEALEEGMEALREDGKINEELLAKMEQVKKSVEELMKEFGKHLFAIDENQKMTLNDMRQAAAKLQEMLPELSERLDQTLAFLEMLRQEKELADLALRAENLSAEQSELAEMQNDQLSDKRQQDLLDRIDNMNNDVQDFFKQQGETPQSSEQVQKLSEQMRSQRDGKTKDDNKKAMSRELLSMSEQLKSKLSMNMMAKMEEDRRLILSMAHDALSLEEWQILIRQQSSGSVDDRGIAFAQQALRNAIRFSFAKSDSLSMTDPKVLTEITKVYRNALSKTTTAISSLAKTDGSHPMEQSVFALREAANTLLSILDESDDDGDESGSSGGMMSGLRRASGRQAALNSMMGQMLQSLLGRGSGRSGSQPQSGGNQPSGNETGGEGGEAHAEARKQAQDAQKAIADELKRLAEAYGKEAGLNMEERVKELEQEALRLAQLLENPPEDIIDQQDRFLSRMLQATLSLNRKDEGKEERKGSTSQTLFSNSGAAGPSGTQSRADSFHMLRKRAFEDNFPEEYRPAIREYFDVLGEMKWTE
ncbi:MAG: hypothetical protein LBI42_05970 [Chitinispirillales bacterium]|jgi:hypothetical protein|nr:hypothetical protein [Chitinispirillales bacterium]